MIPTIAATLNGHQISLLGTLHMIGAIPIPIIFEFRVKIIIVHGKMHNNQSGAKT